MSNFNFTVDTQEMARSIDGVSSHVNAATTAVVTMESAVVAAELAAANRVCQHVERGFFNLIRSQITQKIARLRSAVDSRFIEMQQQGQALKAIKGRMESDYQMVAKRYTRLFQSIDRSLRNRIFELDKAVSGLVNHEMERLSARMLAMQGQVPVHQMESLQSSQRVAISHTKASAHRAIRSMQTFLADSSRQGQLFESILFKAGSGASDVRYLPILVFESDSIAASVSEWNIATPIGSPRRMTEAIGQAVQSAVFASLASMKWAPPGSEASARVAAEFRRFATQSGTADRVQQQLFRLFDASPWQAMTGREK